MFEFFSDHRPDMSRRSWFQVFATACRGIWLALQSERNCRVHLACACIAISLGVLLEISLTEWMAISFSIALVFVAELLNSGLERLARAITREENELLRDGLDLAAGAVLMAAMNAALIGAIVLVPKIWQRFL